MKASKSIGVLIDFKLLYLVYFAGGTFIYMAYDLFVGKTGVLSTAGMWQLLLASMLLAITQMLFYGIDGECKDKKRIALHIIVNYIVMLSFCVAFSWVPQLSLEVILRFSLIFTVIYAGLFIGFTVFFIINRERLNGKLKLWRAENS